MNPNQAAAQWGLHQSVEHSPDQGLINKTYVVGNPPEYVLQWVNPIFSPLIHTDLTTVIAHGLKNGIRLPRLIALENEKPCLMDPEGGCWRLWEYIPGKTIHKLKHPKTAQVAGQMVAEFHRALSDLEYVFMAPIRDVHNTPQRMADLQQALQNSYGHPFEAEALELGEKIVGLWDNWDGSLDLEKRICHGDLKISNLRFSADQSRGICLLDLDTIGPQTLAAEMGDAWRSWCNPSREDQPEKATFNMEIFEASAQSYLKYAPPMSQAEKESLVSGIIRICLELSARFCADVVKNSYFKEDREKYPKAGQHNLLKAKSQLKLAQSVLKRRQLAEQIIRNN